MRHWHWYTTTGTIGGEALMDGGWNPAIDLNNPSEPDETAQNVRRLYVNLPGFAGFFPHDCACSPSNRWCDCARHRTDLKYLDLTDPKQPVMKPKPGFTILVDNQPTQGGSVSDKTPGANVTVKLAGSEIPDGTIVRLVEHPSNPVSVLQDGPVALEFSGGDTNTATMVAPPLKGFVVRMGLQPTDKRHSSNKGFRIRAW